MHPQLHAKYQKNLMSQFREKLVTDGRTALISEDLPAKHFYRYFYYSLIPLTSVAVRIATEPSNQRIMGFRAPPPYLIIKTNFVGECLA